MCRNFSERSPWKDVGVLPPKSKTWGHMSPLSPLGSTTYIYLHVHRCVYISVQLEMITYLLLYQQRGICKRALPRDASKNCKKDCRTNVCPSVCRHIESSFPRNASESPLSMCQYWLVDSGFTCISFCQWMFNFKLWEGNMCFLQNPVHNYVAFTQERWSIYIDI